MFVNPINLKHQSKPDKNPKNGARPFAANDLVALRKAAFGINPAGQGSIAVLALRQLLTLSALVPHPLKNA